MIIYVRFNIALKKVFFFFNKITRILTLKYSSIIKVKEKHLVEKIRKRYFTLWLSQWMLLCESCAMVNAISKTSQIMFYVIKF